MELSVIVPVYNKGTYLPVLLRDLMEQTFRDFECLLIDDGSVDGSAALCDYAAGQDSRFRVWHLPNGGVSHARNLGLDAARGDYITFIDGDDRVEPEYLQRLMALIRESGAELVITGFEKMRPDGSSAGRTEPEKKGAWPAEEILTQLWQEQSRTGIYGFAFGKIFPRRVLGEIRFDEGLTLAEDLDFYRMLWGRVKTVCLADCAGYRYLEGAENGTGSLPAERIDFLSQLGILLRWRAMLRERNAFRGEGEKILNKRLEDYVFFVLRHTPVEKYRERFWTLHDVSVREALTLSGGDWRRRWLFFCLRRGLCAAALGTVKLERGIRRRLGRTCC